MQRLPRIGGIFRRGSSMVCSLSPKRVRSSDEKTCWVSTVILDGLVMERRRVIAAPKHGSQGMVTLTRTTEASANAGSPWAVPGRHISRRCDQLVGSLDWLTFSPSSAPIFNFCNIRPNSQRGHKEFARIDCACRGGATWSALCAICHIQSMVQLVGLTGEQGRLRGAGALPAQRWLGLANGPDPHAERRS